MPSKKLSIKLPKPLGKEERAELEKLCAMLDFVELTLAARFGKAPARAVSASQAIVRAYFDERETAPIRVKPIVS